MILIFDNYVITLLKTLEILFKIVNIGQKCRESGLSKVIISSVLVKSNIKVTKFIRQLNDILKNLCLVNDFYFFSNDNVIRDFI